jgi:hypothetical protein
MSDMNALCAACGQKFGDHSGGTLHCPDQKWNGQDHTQRFNPTQTFTNVPPTNVSRGSGMQCAVQVCRDLNPYAEPNQPNGTYICRSCRQSGRKATP